MSVHRIEVEFIGGAAIVMVDQEMVNARVRVTYKRDGTLSTLRIGQVSKVEDAPPITRTQEGPDA